MQLVIPALPTHACCSIGYAETKIHSSEAHSFKTEHLAERDDVIGGCDFLPDGKILFTEQAGKMLLFDPSSKSATEVAGVPPIKLVGQGGLLDVRVHPEFRKNNLVYFAYVEPVGEDRQTTAIARARLEGGKLSGLKKIFSA